ncbi:uncharacterized protein LOC142906741 [Petromyzon marinus]|uniref:uncharacterized protein LOC142906741 n=1 Tax=Petromyzon marinus TaxID=7757 RepID=UPI003F714D0A
MVFVVGFCSLSSEPPAGYARRRQLKKNLHARHGASHPVSPSPLAAAGGKAPLVPASPPPRLDSPDRGGTARRPAATGERPATTGDDRGTTGDDRGTTGDDRRRPGTTGDDRRRPATTGERPATTGDDRGTTGDDRRRPGNDRRRPGNDRRRPGNDRRRPATTGERPATTGGDRGTTGDDRRRPATTGDDRRRPGNDRGTTGDDRRRRRPPAGRQRRRCPAALAWPTAASLGEPARDVGARRRTPGSPSVLRSGGSGGGRADESLDNGNGKHLGLG